MTLPIYPRNRLKHVLLADPEERIISTPSGNLEERVRGGSWILMRFEVLVSSPIGDVIEPRIEWVFDQHEVST